MLITMESVRSKYQLLSPAMNERARRLWAATEAEAIGWGGVTQVAQATGLSRTTIHEGLEELKRVRKGGSASVKSGAAERVRKPGGGRKAIVTTQPGVKEALEKLVEPVTRGHPQSPLRWTCKSTRQLSEELLRQKFSIGHHKVAHLLHELGYSLQSNRKSKEGESHPQRNAQFEHINSEVMRFQKAGLPVISVDTKKKELIGDFRNGGKEWRPEASPEEVQVHDFGYKDLGKGIPYGVYDVNANQGWVSVGTDHDTAEFAVATIEMWWKKMGKKMYPDAEQLLITADSGGSNASRSKLWKVKLNEFAGRSGLKVSVCHLPPGTSKWNKIEHRLFCHITQNWRARPLLSHQVMVNLIAGTTTRKGLKVKAALDNRSYETGIKVTADELAAVRIKTHSFQGEWNYTILPD
jgi:transposase